MINIFGDSGLDSYAASKGIDVLGRLPLDPKIAGLCDSGKIEDIEENYLDSLVYVLDAMKE